MILNAVHRAMLLAAVALFALSWPLSASARQVQVQLPLEEGKGGAGSANLKDDTLKQAFLQAVLQETQDLLPDQVFEAKKGALGAQLAPKADGLIQSYAEVSRETVDKSVTVSMEVDVNRPALKKTLQDMGLLRDMPAGAASAVRLSVEGWKSPESIPEFDKLLAGQDKFIESARLQTVSVQPAKISARWEVRALDRAGLDKRLHELLPPRGLTYTIE
jgi:hypothetical protein